MGTRGVEDLDGSLGDEEQIGGGRMRRKHPFAGSEFDAAQRDVLELGDVNAGETRDLKEEIGAARHRFRDCSTAASPVSHQPPDANL
jgi:hypothetical protein